MTPPEESRIPDHQPFHFRIRIGVTGRRNLSTDEGLIDAIKSVLAHIERHVSTCRHIALQWEASSCLADGADRIVAKEILRGPEARLKAIIPLSISDYEETFGLDSEGRPLSSNAVEESRREFREMMNDRRTRTICLRERMVSSEAIET